MGRSGYGIWAERARGVAGMKGGVREAWKEQAGEVGQTEKGADSEGQAVRV
jgi:hypothetical protein